MKKNILILFGVILLAFFTFRDEGISYGPGVLVSENPVQIKITDPTSFTFKDFTVKPLAEFNIKARVLSKKNYRSGREAELSPCDLALGWGRMSDEQVLEKIKIWQNRRWYWWRTRKYPIPRREIETHSANMHIIPANKEIRAVLKKVRKGDIIRFSGNLVSIKADDGWSWKSSLTRNDTGAHSCEVVLVDYFKIIDLDVDSSEF